ncbi:MAG: hypothetical protein K8U57_31005 [Planctomycetes bacterium]|nr:hypothetical protein [Planctomycetota bacterium]
MKRSLAIYLVMVIPIAVDAADPPKQPEPAAKGVAPQSDLDKMLRLIGHPLVVDNRRIVFNAYGSYEQVSSRWVKDVEKLKSSAVPEVAKVAKQASQKVEAKLKLIEQTEKAKDELTRAAARKNLTGGVGIAALQDLLFGLNEVELEHLKDAGRISREDVNGLLQRRAELNAAATQQFMKYFAEALPIQILASRKIYRLKNEAAVAIPDAFEPLLERVRDRAGKGEPTVVVRAAIDPAYDFVDGRDTTTALFDVRNKSDKPLTQLTIKMEFATSEGKRTVYGYIPKLEAGAAAWFDPVPVARGFLLDEPRPPGGGINKLEAASYSIWCDQFRSESEKLQPTPIDQFKILQMLYALSPGTKYISVGGQKEPSGRLTFTITRFNREAPNKGLAFDYTETVQNAKAPKVTKVEASVTLPTPKWDKQKRLMDLDPLIVNVKAGQNVLKFTLQEDSKGCWNWNTPLDKFVMQSVPTEEFKAHDELMQRLRAAVIAKRVSDVKALAQEALDKYPDTPAEQFAKMSLSELKDGKEVANSFKVNSVWVGDDKVFTVTELNGEKFTATIAVGSDIKRLVKGTITDTKISWLAQDVRVGQGGAGGDNFGTFGSDIRGDKIDFVWNDGGNKGKYTLRLKKEK